MHHKGRQSKPNSPLLLPSDCSSPGFSASPLCAGNQDQVGFVEFFFFSAVILADSLPHLLRQGQQGFGFKSRQRSVTLYVCCHDYVPLFVPLIRSGVTIWQPPICRTHLASQSGWSGGVNTVVIPAKMTISWNPWTVLVIVVELLGAEGLSCLGFLQLKSDERLLF